MLRRLTDSPADRPKLTIVSNNTPPERPYRSSPAKIGGPRSPLGRGPLRRNPFRFRNPFRPRYLFRAPRSVRAISALGGNLGLGLLAILMVVGLIGNLFDRDESTGNGTIPRPSLSSNPAASPDKVGHDAKSYNQSFTVTDGDTIRLGDGTRVRLVGFNTPEKFEPQCSREAALGNRASARLKELVTAATSTNVKLVACSCKPGTHGTKKCNYGRSCGRLTVDGRDVGETLIDEGLAVSFICGASGCPPTPRPWCG